MEKSKIKQIAENLSTRENELSENFEYDVVQPVNFIKDILDDYRFVRKNYWNAIQVCINLINDMLKKDNVLNKAKSINLILGAVNDSFKGLFTTHEKIQCLLGGKVEDGDLDEKSRETKIYATVSEIVQAHEAIKSRK